MYIGNIAKRYATALEAYSEQENCREQCYGDARSLIKVLPAIHQYLSARISREEKLNILEKACSEPFCQPFVKFLGLVVKHGREAWLRYILQSYVGLYKKKEGIVDTYLTVAGEPSQALLQKLEEITVRQTGARSVNVNVTVDPEIIGGFVFRIEDRRVDTSVASQLKEIQKAFAPHESYINRVC
ncbi:MAG: ATP synthase F1 subunit delta [Bacteroidales bacterium]|nr:ATP synthase F1 subunit delta [Candidatus Equibacterium intestinale]